MRKLTSSLSFGGAGGKFAPFELQQLAFQAIYISNTTLEKTIIYIIVRNIAPDTPKKCLGSPAFLGEFCSPMLVSTLLLLLAPFASLSFRHLACTWAAVQDISHFVANFTTCPKATKNEVGGNSP